MLTKQWFLGYNQSVIEKCVEEKSTLGKPVREPCKVRVGTEEAAEHGLGAGALTGRCPRVRPSQRQEASFTCETRWYRVDSVALE